MGMMHRRYFVLVALVLLCAGCSLKLSDDPFTDVASQHRTQVEPDSFSFGSMIITAFQSGRFVNNGGASDIGWAASTDGGGSWKHDFLAGITTATGGTYDRVSDPSVAFDARHNVWMISSLAFKLGTTPTFAVVVSRSTNGGATWESPVLVASGTNLDKDWTVCDNHRASIYYGHCYTEYDDPTNGVALRMKTSSNGGLTWTTASVPSAPVIGGQPVVQPSGTVVVPILSNGGPTHLESFVSTDGGASYTGPFAITPANSSLPFHVPALMRAPDLPSAEIDASGRIYVVWADCRFRFECVANDIVMSTSTDGKAWSSPARIPIDALSSAIDHFIPGIAVDPNTSGATARLALTYYFYSDATCTTQCQLSVGFISSTHGGATWSSAQTLDGPMSPKWLANTDQGRMVGDYISTSFAGTKAYPVFTVAHAPKNATSCDVNVQCDEATYTVARGLNVEGGTQAVQSAPTMTFPGAAQQATRPTTVR